MSCGCRDRGALSFKVLPTYDNSTIVEIKTLELGNKKEKGYLYLLFKRKLLSERSSSFLGASLTPGAAGVVFVSVQRARAASCQALLCHLSVFCWVVFSCRPSSEQL